MVRSKVTKLDPKGFRRNLDVGGPSPKTPSKPTRPGNNKTSTKDTHNAAKSSNGTKATKSAKRSRRIVESDLSSSDSSASDVSTIFVDNFSPHLEPNHTADVPPSPTSSPPAASLSGNQLITVTAEVHTPHQGSRIQRRTGSKTSTSSGPPVDLIDANQITEIAENSEEPAAIRSKTPPAQTQPSILVSEAAQNTSLPPLHSQEQGSLQPTINQYLATPREKIPPVVIHHNFQGDITKLNKDFHSEYQPLGFTAHRIKSGIACQTSTYRDYLNLQKFLKQRNVPFNLIRHNADKPLRVVIKGLPPSTPPSTIKDELVALGFSVQVVTPMSTWRDRSPLPMHIIDLDNIPQSLKISQLKQLSYIKITVEPYRTRTVPPQCARCQQFYHIAANCCATPACAHCGQDHCSWLCTKRYEPNFTPSCALCTLGDHGARYRGCPYFRSLMEKEQRNKPNKPPSSTSNPNHVDPNHLAFDRRHNSLPARNHFRHPLHTLQSFPPPTSAWSRPLVFSTAKPPPPPTSKPDCCPPCISSPPQDPPPSLPPPNQPRPQTAELTKTSSLPTHTPRPTIPSSSSYPPQAQLDGTHPPRNRLGNTQTESQTQDFVNCIRTFNPNFSFQQLLQLLSFTLHQFMTHPYPSALPVIFSSFLTSLLGLSSYG
jgi:hypothetical protein